MDVYSRTRHRPSFNFSYIIGDPFALSTISIAVIGWIIALGGSIAVDVAGKFPTLTWWGIVFELLVILLVIYVVGAAAIGPYRVALVGFLAMATIYVTNSTNNFVWTGTPASGAVAAGHILLSIINILWIFYFGTTEDAKLHSFVDSFAIHGGHAVTSTGPGAGGPSYHDYPISGHDSLNRRSNPFVPRGMDDSIGMNYRNPPGANNNNNNNNKTELSTSGTTGSSNHQMFTSDQLGGFENSSRNEPALINSGLDPDQQSGVHSTNTEVLSVPTEYPYRATAMYSYQASPDDANEISFEKGEILEVADISGRWWQARRENGEVGICPSNYVQLQGT